MFFVFFYFTGNNISWHRPLCHSLVLLFFMASVRIFDLRFVLPQRQRGAEYIFILFVLLPVFVPSWQLFYFIFQKVLFLFTIKHFNDKFIPLKKQ
jgi:hypothetical protein